MDADDDALARLLAIEEIKQLKARYFRLVDTKAWDEWRDVFTTGVRMELPEGGIELEGRDAVVDSVRELLVDATTVHHGHMPEIEITGPDTARGTWTMYDYVEWPPSEDGARVGLHGYGHYLEEYRREGGRWRIAKTHLARIRVDPLPPHAAGQQEDSP